MATKLRPFTLTQGETFEFNIYYDGVTLTAAAMNVVLASTGVPVISLTSTPLAGIVITNGSTDPETNVSAAKVAITITAAQSVLLTNNGAAAYAWDAKLTITGGAIKVPWGGSITSLARVTV